MKRLRAVKKWKLLFWAVLLLVILALEAFYLRERPLGNKTTMPAANGESISMTDGMEVSEFINCQQERLEGMILQTQKNPQAETGILKVQLYQEGKLIQEWFASQYSYRGTQLKLVLEQPLEQVKGTELEVRLQGTGGDTGIILSTNQHPEEGVFLNGGEKANTRLCLSLIRENVDTVQVFLGVAVFTAAVWAVLFWLIQIKGWRQIHRLFLVCYLVMGIFQLFSVPMFTTPDEENHFLRAYQIAEGQLISQQNQDDSAQGVSGAGGELPAALKFGGGRYMADLKLYDLKQMAQYEIDENDTMFIKFGNTALYAPGTYLPQAVGIKIADLFTDRVLVLAYAGRICNWLLNGLLTALAIRWLPAGKNLAFLLAMLPMSLQQFNSLSPDAFVFSLAMTLTAFVLHMRFTRKEPMKVRHYVLMYAMVFILCQCKVVYAPLCLLLFLIPRERFGGTKKYVLNIFGAGGLGLATCGSWLLISSRFLSEFQPGVDSAAQVSYILRSPVNFLGAILKTFDTTGGGLLKSILGEKLGWLTITTSFTLLVVFAILILIYVFLDNDIAKINFTPFTRAVLLGTTALITLAICASLYVQWTEYHSEVIRGIQGRYFLPLLLPALLAVKPPVKRVAGTGLQNQWMVPVVLGLNLITSCIVLTYALG